MRSTSFRYYPSIWVFINKVEYSKSHCRQDFITITIIAPVGIIQLLELFIPIAKTKFSQDFPKIPSPILTVELERVVNILSEYFGIDELGRGLFNRTELENDDWKGREWRAGDMGILFHLNQGLMLSFFKAAPLEKPSGELVKQEE